jgi:hypothetical protein
VDEYQAATRPDYLSWGTDQVNHSTYNTDTWVPSAYDSNMMRRSDSWWCFGLVIGFFDHFNTWLITTLNCSSIADHHTSQFTRAHSLLLDVSW